MAARLFPLSLVRQTGHDRSAVRTGRKRPNTVVAFDTHAAVKDLTEAGFNENQAEAMVATVGKAVNQSFATKADIADVKAELKADIGSLGAGFGAMRAELEGRILRSTLYRVMAFVAALGVSTAFLAVFLS